MFGAPDFMFGDDGMLPPGYGSAPPTTAIPRGVPQVPGTVVVAETALPSNVKAQPGTVVVVETPLPAGVKAQPGTVVVAETPLPAGVKAQPGTVVVAPPPPSAPAIQRGARPIGPGGASLPPSPPPGARPPVGAFMQGRGGVSVAGGLPPLPQGAPMQPGGHFINYPERNMPLPGRPVGAPPWPSDVQRYGVRDGWPSQWGATAAPSYRDYRSANYVIDGYMYRVYNDPQQSIDVFKSGKLVAPRITAQSSPAAYSAITAEIRGQKRVDPAILVAAINAAALLGTAAIQAGGKKKGKRKRFDSSALSVPPPEPVASGGVPTWVWVAGGGVVLLGLGFLVFGRKAEAPARQAA